MWHSASRGRCEFRRLERRNSKQPRFEPRTAAFSPLITSEFRQNFPLIPRLTFLRALPMIVIE
jgi:hypothetical protein